MARDRSPFNPERSRSQSVRDTAAATQAPRMAMRAQNRQLGIRARGPAHEKHGAGRLHRRQSLGEPVKQLARPIQAEFSITYARQRMIESLGTRAQKRSPVVQ